MVRTREQARQVAAEAKVGLTDLYGPRLQAVYLFGSGARDELGPDSDVDIAVVLDQVRNTFEEHERISDLGSRLSLDTGCVVSFFVTSRSAMDQGRFSIHRQIRSEGLPA